MDEPCRDAPEGRATGMPPLARLKLGAGRRELQLVDLASNRAFGHAKQPSNLGYAQTPYAIAAATLRRDRRARGHRQGGDVASSYAVTGASLRRQAELSAGRSCRCASSQPLNDCTVASVAGAALRPRDRQCIAAGHLPFHAARSRAMRVIPRRPS